MMSVWRCSQRHRDSREAARNRDAHEADHNVLRRKTIMTMAMIRQTVKIRVAQPSQRKLYRS